MELKVKDLRLYLINRNQPTEDCKEKHELVKLIQTFHGIYEPDLETHTATYDTAFSSSIDGMSNREADPSNVPHNSAGRSSAQPHFQPPTYQQTQNSFPTAGQFTPRESSSSSTQAQTSSPPKNNPPKEFPDITDINSVEEIRVLSVRQLKFILRNNFVNFQGVLEKKDLILRAETLFVQQKKDNDSVKTEAASEEVASEVNDANFCKICWDNAVNCVFLECGHMITCIDCSKQIVECPVCRQHISRKVRVFKS